ncbi:MAG: hypothetical protein WKF63_04120, partial [Thermomicrobiales bacterium]
SGRHGAGCCARRASYISAVVAGAGVHAKIVQKRLGHADIAMTLNRYSHVTPDMQGSVADTLDAAFTMVS